MFEANGLIKRKKRDKHSTPKPGDFNNHSYFNIPEHAPYYFPVNYHQPPSGPTSLPVYSYYSPTISSNKTRSPMFSNNENNEYASLPTGNMDQSEALSDKRRFSDPGLPCDSDSSSNSVGERVVHKLTQQVHALKESNRKLHREVSELRMELNMLKQQQNLRHFDRDYEPGMLADIIKEIRDAARVREDALLAKVKHLIEENQFSMNHIHMAADKTRSNERIAKLEEQLKNLSVSNNSRFDESVSAPSSSVVEDNSSSARQVIELEREALVLRRELQDARAKKEESDLKLLQLDKKLTSLLRQNKETASRSDISEDGKTSLPSSNDTYSASASLNNSSGIIYSYPQKVTLTGPVTDL